MSSLQTRSKWTKHPDKLKPGDLVWILEDYTAREIWPVGKVSQQRQTTWHTRVSSSLLLE